MIMNGTNDTHFNMNEHWKHITSAKKKKNPKDAKDLLLCNSTIWTAQNRQICTESRLMVSTGQGKGETGVIATNHDVSLWNEENGL